MTRKKRNAVIPWLAALFLAGAAGYSTGFSVAYAPLAPLYKGDCVEFESHFTGWHYGIVLSPFTDACGVSIKITGSDSYAFIRDEETLKRVAMSNCYRVKE